MSGGREQVLQDELQDGAETLRDELLQSRQAEAKLRQRLQELEARNQVLRDFAFVAAHDLREPLRKVRAFADLLVNRFGAGLPAQGHDYLQRMNQTANRMQVLIDDVLAYSSVTGDRPQFQSVDLAQVLAQVLTDLDECVRSCAARIQADPLPVIRADPTQMHQLFQNLLSNALKFRSEARTPQLQVQCEAVQHQQMAAICLRFTDNGIGFANEFAERIFDPFQRLHGRARFAGSGIGLAIVSRIVERHHGCISARGEPGQGACISVVLPLDPEQRVPASA